MKAFRYVRLLGIQLRTSALLAAQYRYDFVVDALVSVFWTATAVIPLFVVYQQRESVAGWSFGDALVVVGWFVLMLGVLEGAINPSLTSVVEHIRKGTLDFVLLKPADAQFLVSTAKFLPWRIVNLLFAVIIFWIAFDRLGRTPTLTEIGASIVLFTSSVVLLYALWILTVSAAFYVVKIDNLTYLFSSVFDAARWPAAFFPLVVRTLFTYVIPLVLITSFPAEAMLGRLSLQMVAIPMVAALAFTVLSRAVWTRSIKKYTSASS